MNKLLISCLFFTIIAIGFSKLALHRSSHLTPSILKTLRLFSKECNFHGVYYDQHCYCYSNYGGEKCQTPVVPGWYDTNDKCDDLISRLDTLMNISPDNYPGDDDEFPRLSGDSIGPGKFAYGQSEKKWISMRLSTKNFGIFKNDKVTYLDIQQGALGDCYLLAAMIALAHSKNGQAIKNAIITKQDNSNHVFITRWLLDGKPRFVAVDEWVPANHGVPAFAKPTVGGAIWPMILEKAWAKIHGTFVKTQSGRVEDVLQSLTQAPTFVDHLTKYNPGQLFQKLAGLFKNDYPVFTTTPGSKAQTRDVEGHAFALLGVREVLLGRTKIQLVRIMNPWHRDTFQGNPWADNSQRWTADLKRQVPELVNDMNDGVYFLDINDYKRNFGEFGWAETQQGYDSEYQDFGLADKLGIQTIQSTFKVSGGQGKTIYVHVDHPNKRMFADGCQIAFAVTAISIKPPRGVAKKTFGSVVKLDKPIDGDYEVIVTINKKATYLKYFTLTTYNPKDVVAFPKKSTNIAYNKKECPQGCNKKGRCNFFSGKCTCYNGWKGPSCGIKG